MDKERVTPVIDQAKSCKSVDLPFAIPAAASLVVSVSLCFLVDRESGLFVGMWVLSIIGLWCVVRLMIVTNIARNY
jgi:hypothetical protein